MYSYTEFKERLGETYCNECDPERQEATRQQGEARTMWQGIKKGSTEFYGRLTGHAIEQKVAQYSETYGEILLGMHRDMEKSKVEIEKTKELLNEVQQKGQALMSMVENQRDQIRSLDLALKQFRTRVMWSSAAAGLIVIVGGLAWMIHFFK
jgi:uncharacterized coiled-coil DUF342 family protein